MDSYDFDKNEYSISPKTGLKNAN